MFFNPSGLSKRVWKWWYIDSVFFKTFSPTWPPKTRLRSGRSNPDYGNGGDGNGGDGDGDGDGFQ